MRYAPCRLRRHAVFGNAPTSCCSALWMSPSSWSSRSSGSPSPPCTVGSAPGNHDHRDGDARDAEDERCGEREPRGARPPGALTRGEQRAEWRIGRRGGVGRPATSGVGEELRVVDRDQTPAFRAFEPEQRAAVARDVDDLMDDAVGAFDAKEHERLSGRWLGGSKRSGQGEQALECHGRQGRAPVRPADDRCRGTGGEGRAGHGHERGAEQRQACRRRERAAPPPSAV